MRLIDADALLKKIEARQIGGASNPYDAGLDAAAAEVYHMEAKRTVAPCRSCFLWDSEKLYCQKLERFTEPRFFCGFSDEKPGMEDKWIS